MNNKYLPTIISGIGLIVLLTLASAVGLGLRTQAQDTTEYEYAALVYEGDSAFVFTDDLDTNSLLNATLDSMGDDFNLVRSMNLMGERGWHFVDAQPAGSGVTLYLFERVE